MGRDRSVGWGAPSPYGRWCCMRVWALCCRACFLLNRAAIPWVRDGSPIGPAGALRAPAERHCYPNRFDRPVKTAIPFFPPHLPGSERVLCCCRM